jgi:hypothetical protein
MMAGDEALRELVSRNYQLEPIGSVPLRLFFQPAKSFYHQNFESLAFAADHLALNTAVPCCRMIRTLSGTFTLEVNGEPQILMAVPDREQTLPDPGSRLALFHQETRIADMSYFPESPVSGMSPGLVGRLDRLESKFRELADKSECTPFENQFLSNFAYFSGCAENALQFLVTITIDYPEPDPLVLTHHRVQGTQAAVPENPAYWVAEDRSRDLAEWLRVSGWQGDTGGNGSPSWLFLDGYESVAPLSRRTAASLFARLLFPLPYMECCEQYFFNGTGERADLLQDYMPQFEEKASGQEKLLASLSTRYPWISVPEWISRNSAGPVN